MVRILRLHLLAAGVTVSTLLFVSFNLQQLTGTSLSTFLNVIPQIHDDLNREMLLLHREMSRLNSAYSASHPSGRNRDDGHNEDLDSDGATDEQQQQQQTKPLNIVLLYADDWRHDSIGAANASIVRTPFLDWLATQGIRFTHNCVTTAVCWMSRATLYTGQYFSRHQSDYPTQAAVV